MPSITTPATDTEVRIISVAAWALVAVAMALAALVLIIGLSGQAAARQAPEWSAPASTADVIFPPRQHGDGSMLYRPCRPIFERCEVAR